MKIAIISDIKSNVYALRAVLEDSKQRGVDVTLNLGDSFYGPIAPKETYNLIRQSQFVNIMGNEDRKILEASLEQLENDVLLKFVYNDLGEEVLYWIQDLPFEKIIGGIYYMIHGTYFDDSQYLLEENDDKKIIELTDNIEATFIFCSNSTIPKTQTLSSGQIVICPGSIGISKKASYSILSVEEDKYSVEQISVDYDYESAREKILLNGFKSNL